MNALRIEQDIVPTKCGAVIGPKGSVINEIMKRSGCRIVINQDFPEGSMHRIVYTGMQENITAAMRLVDAVLTHGNMDHSPLSSGGGFGGGFGVGGMAGSAPGPPLTFPAPSSGVGYRGSYTGASGFAPGIVGGGSGVGSAGAGSAGAFMQVLDVIPSRIGRLMESFQDIQIRYSVRMNLDMAVNKLTISGENQANVFGAAQVCSQALEGGATSVGGGMTAMSLGGGGGPVGYVSAASGGIPYGSTASRGPGGGGGAGVPRMEPAQQHFPVEHRTPVPFAGPYSLGADGSAGTVEGATSAPDGSHMRVATIQSSYFGRLYGKHGTTLDLIRVKSGAQLDKVQDPVDATLVKLTMSGAPEAVALAVNMVQEVCGGSRGGKGGSY